MLVSTHWRTSCARCNLLRMKLSALWTQCLCLYSCNQANLFLWVSLTKKRIWPLQAYLFCTDVSLCRCAVQPLFYNLSLLFPPSWFPCATMHCCPVCRQGCVSATSLLTKWVFDTSLSSFIWSARSTGATSSIPKQKSKYEMFDTCRYQRWHCLLSCFSLLLQPFQRVY